MNGLEDRYSDRVAFLRIDAASQDGQSAYSAYQLRGHPAFVLLTSSGELGWKGIGEQPGENLEAQIMVLLENP